jgi:hypothetical protein
LSVAAMVVTPALPSRSLLKDRRTAVHIRRLRLESRTHRGYERV